MDDYIVKPVDKALRVLLCLGEQTGPQSLSQICARVGLPKTTVFRYLQTLCHNGFVSHDPDTDAYRLGLRLFELGQLAAGGLRIRDVAWPAMQALRDRFDETVNLGMLQGQEIVYIEIAESRRSLRMQARLGGRDPVHSTALGKAILAFSPEERWGDHLPERLTPRTEHTHTSRTQLQAALRAIRRRGYATDDGETEAGTLCIGAPIHDHGGEVDYALSLSAPASRMDRARQDEIAVAVQEAAAAISRRLGYVGEP